MKRLLFATWIVCLLLVCQSLCAQTNTKQNSKDAKHTQLPHAKAEHDEDFSAFAIYENTAPRPQPAKPLITELPLILHPGERIGLIGNTLLERSQEFGHFEAFLHQKFPAHQLTVRHLAWSADAIDIQARPDNFANTDQHLVHEKADIIIAAFGFNESFAGQDGIEEFRQKLTAYLHELKSKAFNGRSAARIVLVSPIANENVQNIAAADWNNANIELYVTTMREVAEAQSVGFADVFADTAREMESTGNDLTINGIHLNERGDELFSRVLFRKIFGEEPPKVSDALLQAIVDKNRQFFRRFRPLNTFYYTGGRNKDYGYLDFLPAMRNFDLMVANRDKRIWEIAQGNPVSDTTDDSNVPPLPKTMESRGVNEWMTAENEQKAFKVDPRFEVNLFAGEEQFPEIANPIQMRWDSQGRLWVSCSSTYPHVYPGNEPNDRLVILEDTDGDGRADKSSVFADDLHIPLSFEFGNGGVYVSEMPQLTFLKDTNGDGKADTRTKLLSGFGTEDSHHALHDFTWTPDGDLLFRESIFHHSQIETAYGPVRQQNSGWFRFSPKTQRLISFGTYPSTNPWGVTFDDWGQHMASHPIYAAAFHSLDPEYPLQHPTPKNLQAYSGTCGQEFVNTSTFPDELQGHFIKVRYKPTNRIEIHRWNEGEFGFEEEYVSDLLFSTNLSFIPVDLQFGPQGDLYVCDWYNPVKGHAQYSLRDERRDRHSGRIWRITTKGKPLQTAPKIAGASISDLLELLKRPEYRYRYWSKRELRERDEALVRKELADWIGKLDDDDARFRHHQLEALWLYRWLGDADLAGTALANSSAKQSHRSANANEVAVELLRELIRSEDHHARAAATQQLRYWHPFLTDLNQLLRKSANDPNGIVRMEAAIAATYIGTSDAFDAMSDVLKHPLGGHLAYAMTCALGSHSLRPHWQGKGMKNIATFLDAQRRKTPLVEPKPSAEEAKFDRQENLKLVKIHCVPERMLFSVNQIAVTVGQPVKVVFTNEDATDHNLVFLKPGALAEVGMAANEMARDPRNADSDFIPHDKKELILHSTPMIGPNRGAQIVVRRFTAPTEPGIYPFVCTFPGHWVVMNGVMVVANDLADVDAMMAASQPKVVREWAMLDFNDYKPAPNAKDEKVLMRGMQAFVKARCNQCHIVAGHGVNLGPNLVESVKKLSGIELLRQIIEPSSKIHEKFQTYKFLLDNGQTISGVIVEEDKRSYRVATNLLTPNTLTTIKKKEVDDKQLSEISAMPTGLLNVLTRDEILDLLVFLEAGGDMPAHLEHKH